MAAMSTIAPETRAPGSSSAGARSRLDVRSIAVWLGASLIAVFFALIVRDSTIIDNIYVPRGNDSLYHARRILDAAVGARGFYQFDDHIQVPEGSWISWPWAYDYLLAKATQIALWVQPTLDPVAFLVYVPVVWIPVNAALFLAATGVIGLSREMRMLAMLCFALSPLTQLLHSIGMIDHHYVEHTFVLLVIWLGLLWFKQPDDPRRAMSVAATLGLAPAFHNGLFILQLLPLAAVFVLWLRHAAPPSAVLRRFGIALLIVTQLILLPSEPYRNGMFEFGLLSWFHFYIAVCTTVALAFMAWRPFSGRSLGQLALLCLVLTAPLGAQLVSGAGFLSGSFSILDQIAEAQSPYAMITTTLGFSETLSFYSWLLLLAPVLLAFYAYRAFREQNPQRLYYAIVVVFGLALFLDQFRLHHFGFFALVTGGLLLVDDLRTRLRWHRGATFAGTFAVIVLAYQPALRERLFVVYAPGADSEYASAFAVFLDLQKLCAEDPGVVLASPDDGSAIVFHSKCSVIANNFILRTEDKQHIDEVKRLMLLSPAEIRVERPDVKYLFIRVRDFSVLEGDTAYVVEDNRVAKQLLIDEEPPAGYTLVKTIRRRIGVEGVAGVYARLYKVSPSGDGPSL
jgi:hypothetical protein